MTRAGDLVAAKALVADFHRRLWGDGDRGVIDEVIAPEAITHWGDADSNTVEAVGEDVDRYFQAFSDVSTHIDDLLAEDDRVMLRWRTTGTQTGRYGRVPPTGRRITMTGVDIYRLHDDHIVEAWSMWDGLRTYQDLGLIAPDVGP